MSPSIFGDQLQKSFGPRGSSIIYLCSKYQSEKPLFLSSQQQWLSSQLNPDIVSLASETDKLFRHAIRVKTHPGESGTGQAIGEHVWAGGWVGGGGWVVAAEGRPLDSCVEIM